ncbi:MAG: deoxyribonuclease IV [Thermoanaerobaculia bacterium]
MFLPPLRLPDANGDLLGAHVSSKGGLPTIFERANAINASTVALFTRNSNQWNAKPLTDDDVAAFAGARATWGGGPLIAHASYLINLATTNEVFYEKSIAAMVDELQRAARLGVWAVVLHPGAHLGSGVDAGIDQIARSLDRIHAMIPDCPTITLLETAAGQGSCLGCSFEELGRMTRLVDDSARVGICVDTCHVFAAGYDIRKRDAYESMMDEAERHVGIHRIGAVHLNDSKKGLGSRVDRHGHIGEGEIGIAPFAYFLNDSRLAGVPKVLETPKPEENLSDIRNLGKLRALLKGAKTKKRPGAKRKSEPRAGAHSSSMRPIP